MFSILKVIEEGKSFVNQQTAEGNSYEYSLNEYLQSVDLEYDFSESDFDLIHNELKENFQEELLEEKS